MNVHAVTRHVWSDRIQVCDPGFRQHCASRWGSANTTLGTPQELPYTSSVMTRMLHLQLQTENVLPKTAVFKVICILLCV